MLTILLILAGCFVGYLLALVVIGIFSLLVELFDGILSMIYEWFE